MKFIGNTTIDETRSIITSTSAFHNENLDFSSNRQPPESIELIFETLQPLNTGSYYTISYLSPNTFYNCSLNRSETERRVFSKNLHHHDYFELIYVIKGTLYQNIENNRHLYPSGSICILNKNVRHCEEYSSECRIVFLPLTQTFLQDMFSDNLFFTIEKNWEKNILNNFFQNNVQKNPITAKEYIDFFPTNGDTQTSEKMYALFENLTKTFTSQKIGCSYLVKYLLMQIFAELSDSDKYQPVHTHISSERDAYIFEQITELMIATHGRISRSVLEQQLNYNGAYINNIVKKYTGSNIFTYGMTFCMKEAATLLTETSLKITDIAARLDFNNMTHFYSIFKNIYGITPKEFRKKYGLDKTLDTI